MLSSDVNKYSRRAMLYELEYTERYDMWFWRWIAGDAATILDIPCGLGDRAIHLARPGRRVFAADLEPRMISRLRARLEDGGLDGQVVPRVSDMRSIHVAERFERILVIREAFQFLLSEEDASRALRALSRHLAPDGRLVVDLADFPFCRADGNYPLGYYDPGAKDGQWIEDWARVASDGRIYSRQHRQWHVGEDRIRIDLSYSLRPREDVAIPAASEVRAEEWEDVMAFRRYTRSRFEELVRKSSLKVEDIFGGYDRRKYECGDPRIIFVIKN